MHIPVVGPKSLKMAGQNSIKPVYARLLSVLSWFHACMVDWI